MGQFLDSKKYSNIYTSLVLGGDIETYSVHLPSNGVSGGPAMIPFSLVTSDWSMISTFIEHAWACMEEHVNQNKMQQLMKEVAVESGQ